MRRLLALSLVLLSSAARSAGFSATCQPDQISILCPQTITDASSPTWSGSHTFLGSTLAVSGGRVGVGTTNPATLFHMSSGTMRLDGSGSRFTLTGPSFEVGSTTIVTRSGRVTVNAPSAAYTSPASFEVRSAARVSPTDFIVSVTSASGAVLQHTNGAGQLVLGSLAPNTTALLQVQGGASVTGSLNVGGGVLGDGSGLTNVPAPPGVTNVRTLTDFASVNSVDWQNRTLTDASNSSVLNWAGATLSDGGNILSLDWGANRALYDASALLSVDWKNRGLVDTGGTAVVDWGTLPGSVIIFGVKTNSIDMLGGGSIVSESSITTSGGFFGNGYGLTGFTLMFSTGVAEGGNPRAVSNTSTSTFFMVSTVTYNLRGGRPFTVSAVAHVDNGSGAGRIYNLAVFDGGVKLPRDSTLFITGGDDGTLPYLFASSSSVAGAHTMTLGVSTNGTAANQLVLSRQLVITEY